MHRTAPRPPHDRPFATPCSALPARVRPRTTQAVERELVRKDPHVFKIEALSEIRELWPADGNPFVGAFGNKATDVEAYTRVGVPLARIFKVDRTSQLWRTSVDEAHRDVDGSMHEAAQACARGGLVMRTRAMSLA